MTQAKKRSNAWLRFTRQAFDRSVAGAFSLATHDTLVALADERDTLQSEVKDMGEALEATLGLYDELIPALNELINEAARLGGHHVGEIDSDPDFIIHAKAVLAKHKDEQNG